MKKWAGTTRKTLRANGGREWLGQQTRTRCLSARLGGPLAASCPACQGVGAIGWLVPCGACEGALS
jgi:hypothetical protein